MCDNEKNVIISSVILTYITSVTGFLTFATHKLLFCKKKPCLLCRHHSISVQVKLMCGRHGVFWPLDLRFKRLQVFYSECGCIVTGRVAYTLVPLSPRSIIWYLSMGGDTVWLSCRSHSAYQKLAVKLDCCCLLTLCT